MNQQQLLKLTADQVLQGDGYEIKIIAITAKTITFQMIDKNDNVTGTLDLDRFVRMMELFGLKDEVSEQ